MELDWLTIVVGAVCSLLGALGGGSIFFVKENKRSKQLENSQKIIEEWKEMYHEKEKKCNDKDATIEKKDVKIEQLRKKIGELYEERTEFMAKRELELKQKDAEHADEMRKKDQRIAELEMQNKELQWNECRVNGCDKREPPRDRKCIGSCQDCKE
jgi:2C-methyl-D-erythritol 2,4-cyclodiphosphate synthase